MSDIPGFFSTFLAGILSFASPCVLPLIPGYLSFISGETLGVDEEKQSNRRFRLLIRTLYFILGFTLVFVLLAILLFAGMSFAGAAMAIKVKKIAGIIVVLLGINIIFDFIPFLRTEKRGQANKLSTKTAGPLRSILFGMVFAAGWTPCIGPILATILMYAGQSQNSLHAITLLILYSLGLGIPFVLTGLFMDNMKPVLNFLKKHGNIVKIISGILIIGFGIAMFLNLL